MKHFDPATMPARDEDGMVSHPDLDLFLVNHDGKPCEDGDEGYISKKLLNDAGLEFALVEFFDDAPAEMVERYEDAGEPNFSYWEPTAPKGDGWIMVSCCDIEDGPQALFVRPITEAATS